MDTDSQEKRDAVTSAARSARGAGCNVDDLIDRSVGASPSDNAGVEDAQQSSASCDSFSMPFANDLISNSDTGARKIDGEIVRAVSVRAGERWLVAINVAGQVVMLAHEVGRAAAADDLTGGGRWHSVDALAERATSFPVGALTATERGAAAKARACAVTG